MIYVTGEEFCYKFIKDHQEVTELKSTQEDADTRIILHALYPGN